MNSDSPNTADIVERLKLHRSWRDSHGELNDAPNEAAAIITELRDLLDMAAGLICVGGVTTPTAPVQDDDVELIMRLWNLAYNHTAPGDIGRNTYGDAARCIERLSRLSPTPETGLVEALTDALAGWRYIRQHHGDLYGVGWDRVEQGLASALSNVLPDEVGAQALEQPPRSEP